MMNIHRPQGGRILVAATLLGNVSIIVYWHEFGKDEGQG
jgi:hypothetical protein